MPAAEQVQMQMVHRLSAIVACVHDDPVSIVQLLFACDLAAAAIRWPISAVSSASAFAVEAMCCLGIISRCVGACGLMSGKPMQSSSS